MAHKAEIDFKLSVTKKSIDNINMGSIDKYDVVFLRLPDIDIEKYCGAMSKNMFEKSIFSHICNVVLRVSNNLKIGTKFLVMGNPMILPYVHEYLQHKMQYQTWIVVRLSKDSVNGSYLKNEHDGILVYVNGGNMQHSVMRIGYEYCQSCERTVKDYGGKKHLYHEYGTALSDVWKDFEISRTDEFPKRIIERIRDLFSIEPNKNMLALSLKNYHKIELNHFHMMDSLFPKILPHTSKNNAKKESGNKLINGDCIKQLQNIKSNTIDTIFVDPPYNLSKNYDLFKDKMTDTEYFAWCDKWLYELSRVLRPGGSLFVLNIPVSAARHFLFIRQILNFQNWIVWDALSTPLKKIMPAHYSILYFTKGSTPNHINKLQDNGNVDLDVIMPMNYGFCARPKCIKTRHKNNIEDHKQLTDLWTDIHRIKHNSLREDHPTLLPPKLLRRLISMSSNKKDVILDCFNGVGTTTLVASQLGRNYVGIEKSENYHTTAKKRHILLLAGNDPFAKRKTTPLAKNSTLQRVKHYKYEVPKRTLQLEVKAISKKIRRMPEREDVIRHSRYPIKYFDNYFRNWFEVTEAARTTGMSECKTP